MTQNRSRKQRRTMQIKLRQHRRTTRSHSWMHPRRTQRIFTTLARSSGLEPLGRSSEHLLRLTRKALLQSRSFHLMIKGASPAAISLSCRNFAIAITDTLCATSIITCMRTNSGSQWNFVSALFTPSSSSCMLHSPKHRSPPCAPRRCWACSTYTPSGESYIATSRPPIFFSQVTELSNWPTLALPLSLLGLRAYAPRWLVRQCGSAQK
mmetsp:Transcript_13440/g.22370  ORF Transcript_13440/g.22370 Transcript_13440/m.22370 type:complete len:209 (-) Transcript_13440:1361-1987(-)